MSEATAGVLRSPLAWPDHRHMPAQEIAPALRAATPQLRERAFRFDSRDQDSCAITLRSGCSLVEDLLQCLELHGMLSVFGSSGGQLHFDQVLNTGNPDGQTEKSDLR